MKKDEMKKILVVAAGLFPAVLSAQQFPVMQGYKVNSYNLSPAFAGLKNDKVLFVDYHSDWMGMDGGPTTYQLNYSSRLKKRSQDGTEQSGFSGNTAALGGRFIYDKTDIYSQLLLVGTYAYDVRLSEDHRISLALSAGFYKNGVNYSKYLNNPDYIQDVVLSYGRENSKFQFASDIAALYRYRNAEAGVVFSSIVYGTTRYYEGKSSYQPFRSVLLHGSYLFNIDDKWSLQPVIALRGGHDINTCVEFSPTVTWNERFWGTAFYRTEGVFGIGFGGEIFNGITLNYSYNVISDVSLYSFGSSQLTMGVNLFAPPKIKKAS